MEEAPEAESDAWACERSRPRRSSSHKLCPHVQSSVSIWVYYDSLKYLDIFQGAPLSLPKPLSDQFPVRVCSCPLCIINRL